MKHDDIYFLTIYGTLKVFLKSVSLKFNKVKYSNKMYRKYENNFFQRLYCWVINSVLNIFFLSIRPDM